MKRPATYQKLRGGYYTPPPIAKFLSSWAIRSASDRVLEPSCGDGVFLEASAKRLFELRAKPHNISSQILAYELDGPEAAQAAQRLCQFSPNAKGNVHSGDFFSSAVTWNGDHKFDAIVGNPPFVRYQNFPEEQRINAFQIMQKFGLHPNRLTNAWVPFVVAAAGLLKANGRLAMVAPAELLQVTYAAELRLFLAKHFDQIRVITFRGLPFPGIQQEVVLLLAIKDSSLHRGIEVLELDDASDLFATASQGFGENGVKTIDQDGGKWTQYYLSQQEIELLRSLRADVRLTKFGELAHTDVGVVTGMNDVFVLPGEEVSKEGLTAFVCRLVGRSAQLPGTIFKESDWARNVKSGSKVFLLNIPPVQLSEMPANVAAYFKKAEQLGLHLGFKCRTRKLWHVVPSVYVPDAFMFRQIHHYPKLIANQAKATCTDTIHRVRFKRRANASRIAAAFMNSLTFAFSEIIGRSYGGGVLELEPNEADTLPIPLLHSDRLDPNEIDRLVRSSPIENVLAITDKVLLAGGLGLKDRQIKMLRSIWLKLQRRRTGRRNGND